MMSRLILPTRGALLLALALASSGCPRKDSTPVASDRPYRPVVKNRALVREPPAKTPEEAFYQFMRARSFEDHYETLTQEAKKRWDEWLAWGKRCAELDRKFNEELDQQFGKDTGPSVPPRVALFPAPIGRIALLQGQKWYRDLVSSNPRTETTVELVVGWTGHSLPGAEAPPQHTFRAVKEDDSWKLDPPSFYDPAHRVDLLQRYVLAKERVFGEIGAVKHQSRAQAVKALTTALRRGRAAPGSPEEAIEIYEAALMALDLDEYSAILCNTTKDLLHRCLAFTRRNTEAHESIRSALVERFGTAGRPSEPYVFDPTIWYGQGLLQIDMLELRAKDEGVVEAKVRRPTYEGDRDVLLVIRKEDGGWRIDPEEDTRRFTVNLKNEHMAKDIERNERYAKALREGKFATRAEYDKARLDEQIADGGAFVIPTKKP